MKDEAQRTKQTKMQEELDKAKQAVDECKKNLADKKKQVDFWKSKVDRASIERIRAFQNPPTLIGQIMDMMMVLIGKKKFPENFFSLKTTDQTNSQSSATKEKNEISNSDKSKLIRSSNTLK
jgi:dynein heavy chain, axonemal